MTLKLLVKDEFISPIINGEKITTIRKGERFTSDRNLVIVPLCDDSSSGYTEDDDTIKAIITRISYKTLYEITNKDAELDGFQDKRELEEVLHSIYPDIDDETIFTIIQFEV